MALSKSEKKTVTTFQKRTPMKSKGFWYTMKRIAVWLTVVEPLDAKGGLKKPKLGSRCALSVGPR